MIVRDYRDLEGVGYVIERGEKGFRWVFYEPPHIDMSTLSWHASVPEALRDAADDWEYNGSGGRTAATLRGVATRLEKKAATEAARDELRTK